MKNYQTEPCGNQYNPRGLTNPYTAAIRKWLEDHPGEHRLRDIAGAVFADHFSPMPMTSKYIEPLLDAKLVKRVAWGIYRAVKRVQNSR